MGPLSATLTLLALNGALMTALLARAPDRATANRFLAALVGLISLRLVIYVLGFAGAYDDHPWITFAPLDASLAFGPLLWLYVETRTRGSAPRRWWRHLAPVGIQLSYSVGAFALPTEMKLRWYGGPHLGVVAPLGLAAVLGSCAVYLALAWRRQHEYQQWLDATFSDRDRWRLGWLTAILGAFAATLLAAAVTALINAAITPLNYFARTPVVIASSLLAYTLGLLGWKNAGLDLAPQPLADEPFTAATPAPSRPAMAFPAWAQRIAAAEWWRENGLTLGEVARRLGTSERTLSRALSEGAGCHFNDYVNGLRVAGVMRTLEAGTSDDLLTVALDCGFSSKASFNRAFLRHTGMTPSRWRTATSQKPPTVAVGAT